MALSEQALSGPVPGQSLTGEPNAAAWERPPEIVKPEDAAKYHLNRLDDLATEVLDALELGLDVKTLTEGILRGAVSEGVHSIDVSMIIAPLVHEKITGIADGAGIEYEEGIDQQEDRSEIDFAINKRKVDKMLTESEPVEVEEPVEETPRPQGRGFMTPRGEV